MPAPNEAAIPDNAKVLYGLGLSILQAVDDGVDPRPVVEAGRLFAQGWLQEYGAMPIGPERAAYCDAGAYFLRAWAEAEDYMAESLIAAAEQLEAARDINLHVDANTEPLGGQ